MLQIKPIMNTSSEDVLAFKTCCGLNVVDQNLEIHVQNIGDEVVKVHSRFELKLDLKVHLIDYLLPQGVQQINPGQTIAFYCQMDEQLWAQAKSLTFMDTSNKRYSVNIESDE